MQTLKRSLKPLAFTLEKLASSDDGDATAVGLAGIIRRYHFVSCVFFMAVVLPILTRLSKVLQTENLSITSIKPAIARASSTLQGIDVTSMINSADWQHDFEMYIEANELPDGDATDFYQTCVKPFIEALLSNLDERFPEDAIAVLDAADVFNPINIASCTSPESRYMYGRSEVLILAEHFGLETTTVLTHVRIY